MYRGTGLVIRIPTPILRPLLPRPMCLPIRLVIACVSLATLTLSQAQSDQTRVRVKISTDSEADARLRPYSIVRSSPNAIMMFRNGEFDVRAFGSLKGQLDLYDREKLTYIRGQEPVTKLTNGTKLLLEDMVYFDGRPLMIARSEGEHTTIYFQVLERNLTRLPPPYERLVSWPVDVKTKRPLVVSAGEAIRAPFMVDVSRDSSHMLIRSPEIRGGSGQAFYLFAMVGKDMEVLWQHVVPVAEKADRSSILDVAMDDNGNAYMVLKNKFSNKEVVEDEVNFEIKLVRISAEGAVEANVDLGRDVFPSSAILQGLADDRIAFAGVYAKASDKKLSTLGNFITIFDSTMAFTEPMLLPFHEEGGLDAEGEPEEEPGAKFVEKDKKRMAAGTDLIDLLPKKDGGFFLVNELFYSYEYYDMSAKRSVTRYAHGPIQVRNMKASGAELWSSTFRRWLVSSSPILGRVFAAEYDDSVFLFVLDSEEMAERRKAGEKITPNHMKDPYSAYVSFDEKGEYKIKPVLKSGRDVDFISGWNLVRTGDSEYIALGTEKLVSGRFLPVRIEFSTDSK